MEQNNQIQRVADRIGDAILDFVGSRQVFVADDLRRHVNEKVGQTAPGSADRILRMLRQGGKLNYRVLSRRDSLYETLSVAA